VDLGSFGNLLPDSTRFRELEQGTMFVLGVPDIVDIDARLLRRIMP